MNIGARLKRVRLLRNLSQQEMAELLGLKTQQNYAKYEKRESVEIYKVKQWSKILKVDLLSKDFIETQEQYDNLLQEEPEEYNTTTDTKNKSKEPEEVKLEIIRTLASNNEILCKAQEIIARSNETLANNSERLIKLLEDKSTHLDHGLFREMTASLRAYKHFLKEHVVGKNFSIEKITQELDKLRTEALNDTSLIGNSFV